jgi:hypothetical protein
VELAPHQDASRFHHGSGRGSARARWSGGRRDPS